MLTAEEKVHSAWRLSAPRSFFSPGLIAPFVTLSVSRVSGGGGGGGASKSCLRGAVATAGAKMESVRKECSGNWVRLEKHDSLITLIRLQKGHR